MAQSFTEQGLMDAYGQPPGVPLSCSLPYGGVRGTGAKFSQGQAIGVISVVAANEVRTLSLNGATGTITVTWASPAGVTQASWASSASNATVLAAIIAAIPGWTSNITVTGTPGTTVIITFINQLAAQAIGGGWTVTATSGTPTWAVTTAGSSTCQYDIYNSSTNNDVDGVLAYDVLTGLTGARHTPDIGASATNQASSAMFYAEGMFNVGDLVGFDANALTLKKVFSKAGGTLIRLI